MSEEGEVVEMDYYSCLENSRAVKGPVGSNPTLSAKVFFKKAF